MEDDSTKAVQAAAVQAAAERLKTYDIAAYLPEASGGGGFRGSSSRCLQGFRVSQEDFSAAARRAACEAAGAGAAAAGALQARPSCACSTFSNVGGLASASACSACTAASGYGCWEGITNRSGMLGSMSWACAGGVQCYLCPASSRLPAPQAAPLSCPGEWKLWLALGWQGGLMALGLLCT
jgi:hypothetical protein